MKGQCNSPMVCQNSSSQILPNSHAGPTARSPFGLLPAQELLQHLDPLLKRIEPLLQLLFHLCTVVAQLGVKVLSVGRRTHGSREDGLDYKRVVGLESVGVSTAEGIGEFFRGGCDVAAEGLGCEV